ncbi:hypothetical protein IB642_07825 [Allofrancisella guangzhouensis]|nr:hypothetical protein [Allofrancisella guangzhouensis]MBK2044920.1 hypothetical protein [Allofrancisella guangzhouensis]
MSNQLAGSTAEVSAVLNNSPSSVEGVACIARRGSTLKSTFLVDPVR